MMTKRLVMLALGAVWMALGGSPAQAVQGKCLAGKSKCVVTLTSGLLKCHQTAETPGKTPDPNAKGCVDKVVTKFDGGATPEKGCFAKLEGKTGNDCLTFADTEVLQAAVQACVDQFVSAVDPPPLDQSKCGAGKKKCVANQAKGLLSCHRKAQTPGKPENPNDKGCLDKVAVKFDGGIEPAKGCFAKLEAKTGNDCLPPLGNTAAVRGLVESCLASVLAQLEGGVTTTTAPPTTTTTGPTTTTTTGPTTSTTAAPTTTTTTAPTTTTSTTLPQPVTCGPSNTLNVTATLVYEPRIVGGVFGMFMEVDYPTAVSLPGTGTASTVRARFTNLLVPAANYRFIASDTDSNGNTVDDRARTLVTANTTEPVPSAAIERIQFDCPSGTVVQPSQFACRPVESVDSAGQPFPPATAALITCSLSFATP